MSLQMGIQHNDILSNDTQLIKTQQNDIQQNKQNGTLSITTINAYAEGHYA
jgi:hypothetical protein